MVSDAISQGNVSAINYFVAQKYVDAFAQLAQSQNQKTLIVPADLATLVGSIAGVGELLKSGRGGPDAPPPAPKKAGA